MSLKVQSVYVFPWNSRCVVRLVQRGGDWTGPQPAQLPLAVPNVTAQPSTASVPITVLLCNGPLLCGFNVPVKVLMGDNVLGDGHTVYRLILSIHQLAV